MAHYGFSVSKIIQINSELFLEFRIQEINVHFGIDSDGKLNATNKYIECHSWPKITMILLEMACAQMSQRIRSAIKFTKNTDFEIDFC